MAIPMELATYSNEDDFIQRFLIPLLKRMGYSVFNYHGTTEHGRDLIAAEIDRFGHVRYHGVQAKYVDSIGLEAMKSVIDDCEQAFTTPFTHPQTGATEYISTFYAVNGGGIPDQSRNRYFAYLKARHGDNAKLLDGKSLIALDRWATINTQQLVGETLNALRFELELNRLKLADFVPSFEQILIDPNKPFPADRLRDVVTSGYLARPVAQGRIPYAVLGGYFDQTRVFNRLLDSCEGICTVAKKQAIARAILASIQRYESYAATITAALVATLSELGPMSGL